MRSISSWRGAPLLLGGEHERPVLNEAALVEQVVEVLACRAAALGVALAHRVGPAVVAADVVALVDLGEVLALPARPSGRLHRGVARRRAVAMAERRQPLPLLDRLADLDVELGDRAASRSATISCSIFIASMTTTGGPAATCSSAAAGVATTVPVNGATRVWLVSAGTGGSLRFAAMSEAPALLWEPSDERIERATLTRFTALAL